jgi:hypothetical protein
MVSIEYDLNYLAEAVPSLEGYLHSTEIYWAVGGSPPAGHPAYPRLTLGNVLLSRARLRAWEGGSRLSPEQAGRLSRLDIELGALRSKWRVAWSNKAGREFSARLRLWRDYLEEYRENPAGNVDRFAYEVGRRVMLQLLAQEADKVPPAEKELLAGLDRILEAVLVPAGFVWELELAAAFPREVYPYLYGKPKA